MSSTIAPVGNKILVLPLKKVEEQINGIIHTQVEDADLHRGEVVAVSKELVTPEGEPLYSVGDKSTTYGWNIGWKAVPSMA
jgi:co-chaperonin GroES (HSP10)